MASTIRRIERGSWEAARTGVKRVPSILACLMLLLLAGPSVAQEPTQQPRGTLMVDPTPPPDTVAELQITWRAGDGEGTIVLMNQGGPVDADPVDGTTYTADAAFGSGDEIGTGNFVVFVGAATSVTVTNLQSDAPYFVKLYSYNAPGGVFDYLTVSPDARSSGHNASHALDCQDCHFDPAPGGFHGSFIVPRDTVQATTCKTCHNPTGLASDKAAVDLHTGPNYTTVVDCGSCHNVHNNATNQIATDTHSGITAANRQWIRANTTKYVAAAQEPALFQGRCTGNSSLACDADADCIAAGAGTCTSNRFFAYDDTSSPWNGLCQNCHTQTGTACCGGVRHTNDSAGPGDHLHEMSGGAPNNCTACHTHEGQDGVEDGFTPQGGTCTGCHNQPREIGTSGVFRRQILEGTSSRCTGDGATICTTDTDCTPTPGGYCTNGEFGVDFRSHHVNGGTGAQIATKWDCVVCHAEGDVLTGSPDDTYHRKDGVQLKDVDTGAVYADWATLTAAQRSDFCLSCHDADGATMVTARTDPDPDATTDALNPFNDGVTNAHEPAGLDGTPAPHARGRCSVTTVIACGTDAQCPGAETCQLLKVVDVASQFDTANASHHAVLGAAYGSAAPFGSNVDNAIQGVRTDLAWNSVLGCEDCHYGSPSRMLSGHGTAEARYMLRDKDGNDTLPTPSSTGNLNVICFRCHIPTGDPDTYDDTVSTYEFHIRSNHIDDTLNLYGISCLNCHGGAEFGAVHGVDGPVTDDDGGGSYNPNVFTWGSGLDLMSNWTSWARRGVTCSSRAANTNLSSCTQHGSQVYTRGQTRTYRSP